ncbi:MAG: hypothetical protein ACT4PU_01275 [Planctomycetota bacterium]
MSRAPAVGRKAAAAPSAPRKGTAPAKSGATAEAGTTKRGAAGRRKPGHEAAAKSDKKSSPLLLIGVIGGALLLGGAVWFFGFREAGPAAPSAGDANSASPDSASAAGEGETGSGSGGAVPSLVGTTEAGAAEQPSGSEPGALADQAAEVQAPEAQAPAAPKKTAAVAPDDYNPILSFELVPPVPGTSAEDFALWSQLVRECYIESPTPRRRKELKAQLAAIDVVDLIPAYINALHGLDMSDNIQARDAFDLVENAHVRLARTPTFYFPDGGRMSRNDQWNRSANLDLWIDWYLKKIQDPKALEEFRLLIAERQAKGETGDP